MSGFGGGFDQGNLLGGRRLGGGVKAVKDDPVDLTGDDDDAFDLTDDVGAPSLGGGGGGTGFGGFGGVAGALDTIGGRVYPTPGEDFGEFARRVRPTEVSPGDLEWLQVVKEESGCGAGSGACAMAIRAIIDEYKSEWLGGEKNKRVSAAVKEGVWKRAYEAAIRHGEVAGKWMLFPRTDWVDGVWEKVATAVGEGKLGNSAKVAPCEGVASEDGILICVYVKDFTDCADVRRVLKYLKEIKLTVRCGFKADALTGAGLMSEELKALRLADSWQLHVDILKDVFPPKGGVNGKAKKRGFDLSKIIDGGGDGNESAKKKSRKGD